LKKLEIFTKNIFLELLLLFKKKEKPVELLKLDQNSKILFIRLNRIGDALVTTPLLYLCKKNLNCKIYVLASTNNYFVFNNSQLIDEIIIFNKKIKKISSAVNMINKLNFDAIVDLHDDVSTTVSYLMAFSNCKYKIGLNKKTSKLYNCIVRKLDASKYHIVQRTMEFAKPFNIKYDLNNTNIVYSPKTESLRIAEAFINKIFSNNRFLVGLNISAGSDARFWGVQRFKDTIDLLLNYDINLVILCVERDLKKAWEIAGRRVPIFYRPIFDEFSAMISKLNFLFTPDTSIVHIASAFKVPLFGIYVKYKTNDMIWSPFKSEFESIITTEPTLENLSFEQVKEKFIPFFEKKYYEYKN
jgi:ADP-heptose:LPS heptosyltransferase